MKTLLSVGVAVLGCCPPAMAEPPPRSLDQALVETLSLGSAAGCGVAFGLAPTATAEDHDNALVALRDTLKLGKEVVAACGSSAVISAASLGGSLGSLQTTKTVSQFRMARNRADSRLDGRGKRAGLDEPELLVLVAERSDTANAAGLAIGAQGDSGLGMFARLSHERRNRATTALEAGYGAGISEAVIGIDYATRDNLVAGVWLGQRGANADYRAAPALIAGLTTNLDASTQADLCKVGPGGGFDDKGTRLGVFIAKRMGEAFADVGAQYSRRNYSYRRNVCAIEASGNTIDPDAASATGYSSGGFAIDDIYAGTISGKARLTEWGVTARAGFDVRGEQFEWGPRLSLTYLRTLLGAYTETGRTSVTNTVRSNPSNAPVIVTARSAGDPTGLELAFDQQRRTSLQAELQLVAAYRHEAAYGTLVPRVSASWQHEFKGERQLVAVRMAQDLRDTPTRFSFTTDSVDKNKGTLALGLSLLRGPAFAADVEVSRLIADNRFDATTIAVQALWRF